MPDPTEDEQPFNADLPKLFANYTTWWNTVLEEKDETFPLFEFFLPLDDEQPYPALPTAYVNGWHTVMSGHLLELVRRDAYAEKTRLELAEKCFAYRGDRDDALAGLTKATNLLQRLVGHDDEPCDIDHNGYCQAHSLRSEPCAVASAREFLNELEQQKGNAQ